MIEIQQIKQREGERELKWKRERERRTDGQNFEKRNDGKFPRIMYKCSMVS